MDDALLVTVFTLQVIQKLCPLVSSDKLDVVAYLILYSNVKRP